MNLVEELHQVITRLEQHLSGNILSPNGKKDLTRAVEISKTLVTGGPPAANDTNATPGQTVGPIVAQ
jgi:hypothetical protein